MSFDTTKGTHGGRQPRNGFMRWVNSRVSKRLRRKGGQVMGFDALVLTTVGRKSGVERTTPLGWFPDGAGNWLVVASANGAPDNPGWYYNLAAAPSNAKIEVGGETIPVTAEQLHGDERDTAYAEIAAKYPRWAGYQKKTDREIPVIRLTRQAG